MSDLVNELSSGVTSTLEMICSQLPQLAQSYRFLDHLISHIAEDNPVQDMLLDLRARCTVPKAQEHLYGYDTLYRRNGCGVSASEEKLGDDEDKTIDIDDAQSTRKKKGANTPKGGGN